MLTGKTNDEKIWNYLIAHGLTPHGAAGMLASVYLESGCQPNNLQNSGNSKLGMTDTEYTAAVDSGAYDNFDRDGHGYGICQWTYWSRKRSLRLFAKSEGKRIDDLEMQLDFLMKELGESFKAVLSVLKTATDVETASNSVLMNYEKPASVLTPGEKAERTKKDRAAVGQTYYDKYAQKGGANTKGFTNSSPATVKLISPSRTS